MFKMVLGLKDAYMLKYCIQIIWRITMEDTFSSLVDITPPIKSKISGGEFVIAYGNYTFEEKSYPCFGLRWPIDPTKKKQEERKKGYPENGEYLTLPLCEEDIDIIIDFLKKHKTELNKS